MKYSVLNGTRVLLAMLVTFFITYLAPCSHINGWTKAFGYPFEWFTVYHNTIGESILGSTSVNILQYFLNVVVYYLAMELAVDIYKKYGARKTE